MKTIKFHTDYGLVTSEAEVVSPKRLKIIKIVQVFGLRAGILTSSHQLIPKSLIQVLAMTVNTCLLQARKNLVCR